MWRRAGVPLPPPGGWYVEAGQGMGETLRMADQGAVAFHHGHERHPVAPHEARGPIYHVLFVNPRNAPRVNQAGATALARYLVAPATQARIGTFGRSRFGQGLFVPDAERY